MQIVALWYNESIESKQIERADTTMKLDNNLHSVYSLHYHLILVTKYRKSVFNDEMSDYAKAMFERLSDKYGITCLEWNHDGDHIHVLFKAEPKSELSKFINVYKSASSRLIKRDFPHVKTQLWKEMFWSKSFCLITSGGATIETIQQYIQSQSDNHK